MKPSILVDHSCWSLSPVSIAARSISTPPGQDASPSQVIPPQFVRFPQQFTQTTRSGDERTNHEATAPPSASARTA